MSGAMQDEAAAAGPGASTAAIQTHYDVSNAFFALWLDRTMSYSCALWAEGDDLEQAQVRKLDYHLEQACARGKSNLLDIGCGWGALLHRAVDKYQVAQAVGLTLSQAQMEWAAARPCQGTEVRLESWAEHVPARPYDAIVSVGAFEHFAKPGASREEKLAGYRWFFEWCHAHSVPDCHLSLQSIVYENYDETRPNPFVEQVFPESELPRVAEIALACEGLWELKLVRNDRDHYAKTLKEWYRRLRANRDRAIGEVGAQTYAHYEKYLGAFVVGFHSGSMNLVRLSARRVDTPCVVRTMAKEYTSAGVQ